MSCSCTELAGAGAVCLALLLLGCSRPTVEARAAADANDTGGSISPRSDLERALLRAISSLPDGTPRQVAGATVVAEPAYTAASGRTCRPLNVSSAAGKASHLLACASGSGWFFVPDVFSATSTE